MTTIRVKQSFVTLNASMLTAYSVNSDSVAPKALENDVDSAVKYRWRQNINMGNKYWYELSPMTINAGANINVTTPYFNIIFKLYT